MIEGETIVHEVEYPHPPERVWEALVDSKELSEWLMPNDFVPELGHDFALTCDSHGLIHGEVLEIDAPLRLKWRWRGSFGETIVTFELTPTEHGTGLRLEHRNWHPEATSDQNHFDGGWGLMLGEGLRAVLAADPQRAETL